MTGLMSSLNICYKSLSVIIQRNICPVYEFYSVEKFLVEELLITVYLLPSLDTRTVALP